MKIPAWISRPKFESQPGRTLVRTPNVDSDSVLESTLDDSYRSARGAESDVASEQPDPWPVSNSPIRSHVLENGRRRPAEQDHEHNLCDCFTAQGDPIVLNVSGRRYETWECTLRRFPDSLLGDPRKRRKFYISKRNEFFFDRHRDAFQGILYYYQSGGVLLRPESVSENVFTQEVLFFDLGKSILEDSEETKQQIPTNKILRCIWMTLDDFSSSIFATAIGWFSVAILIVSVASFCLETVPEFDPYAQANTSKGEKLKRMWFQVDCVCHTWFTVEFLLRLISAPSKLTHLKSKLTIIDLLALIPFYVSIGLDSTQVQRSDLLGAVRVVRVIRIFKLLRFTKGLTVLVNTMKDSISEMCMLAMFLLIGVILFSSSIYFAEHRQPNTAFKSIPHAGWWAVVTMTTVGYGDAVPTTLLGKLIGTVCTIFGVLSIAIPIPIIVSKFEVQFKKEKDRREREEEKRKRVPSKISTKFVNTFLYSIGELTGSSWSLRETRKKRSMSSQSFSCDKGNDSSFTVPERSKEFLPMAGNSMSPRVFSDNGRYQDHTPPDEEPMLNTFGPTKVDLSSKQSTNALKREASHQKASDCYSRIDSEPREPDNCNAKGNDRRGGVDVSGRREDPKEYLGVSKFDLTAKTGNPRPRCDSTTTANTRGIMNGVRDPGKRMSERAFGPRFATSGPPHRNRPGDSAAVAGVEVSRPPDLRRCRAATIDFSSCDEHVGNEDTLNSVLPVAAPQRLLISKKDVCRNLTSPETVVALLREPCSSETEPIVLTET